MDKTKIKDYLKQLKKFETKLNAVDDNDLSIIDDIDNLLVNLEENANNEIADANILNIRFKKLVKDAVTPTYSKVGDAGLDLTIIDIKKETNKEIMYGFGIAVEIPIGYVGLLFPRSSVRKFDIILSNCVGVIDSGYRGEIMATFKKEQGSDSKLYKTGERGAQLIILPYPKIQLVEVDALTKTERNTGGFGHTGN